ncbi:histidine kinase [Mesorhizobium loti]|uniref:histidine kinase n=1 Tax=Rhizobium loti TaxID=381 RepID=A0A101KUT7_RHILI|nr:histidine kinase [Mesorhizobium loti]
MDVVRFLDLAAAIAAAVGKLHQRGLVHKDIKPANILLNTATNEVRLTGFGMASRLPRERQSPHPPETIAGTLAYMAPEQTGRMNRSVDSRSDLYALGVTFYKMLTGSLPFAAADPMEWLHCHIARLPIPPATRVREIPGAVSAIVMKLLAKQAEDRYQTAAGLESDLRSCLTKFGAQGRIVDFPLGEHDTPDRLLIPEKLYGRGREVETLLAAFDRIVNGGAPELILVSGYSGIGKSSVVNELQPVLVPPRGLFASGKFDQLKRDVPYATLAQALQSLVRPLLGKSDEDLAPWRGKLREALGPNARLMLDLVPELRLLTGEALAVGELPPQDAKRRFHAVLQQFIGVFAQPEHPLALFLDDLQWLDAATLDLLEDLVCRSDVRNLLIIGAFRDNEVTPSHPLMRKLETIRTIGTVQDIKLAPLTTNDLGNLVADTLLCDVEHGSPLAELVRAKTDGNPLFVIQFLHMLTDEGLLAFDHEAARWSWELGAIHAKRYTDNVMELLAERLTRLPPDTQGALRQFACLGNVADISKLSIVLEMPENQVHAALGEALRQQLIERVGTSYKFVHDRMQEASYALIPEVARAEAHLKIGRTLVAQIPAERRDAAIFEIVNQLNRGTPLITSRAESEQLAELNLTAGKRAKASTAYASALAYLTAGAGLLSDDVWERRQGLAFELELNRADCEVCVGAQEEAEKRLAVLATRTIDTIQRCLVAHRRVDLYVMLGAGEKGVTIALECLRHVGIDWSAHPTEAEARREYERIWSLLGDRSIEDLVELPTMQDPQARATLDVLTSLVLPALYTDKNLYALGVCMAANLNLEHGNSEAAPVNYVTVAMIAGPRFGHYDEGYRFGKLACDLVERRGLTHFGARAYVAFAIVVPWTRPLREGIDPSRRAFQMAKDHSDATYASLASRGLSSILVALGDPLDQFEREAQDQLEFVQRFGFFLDRLSAPLALARTLRGKNAKFGSLDDGAFTERSFEERITGQPARAFLECYYWIRKLQARFLARDYLSAVVAAEKAESWYAKSAALSLFPAEEAECHFYAALARAACCEPLGSDPYATHREALDEHERQLRAWAANCPQNFEDRAALVGAEIARIEGRPLEAMDLYERAIASARTNGFVHNEAIAHEVAARFYAARGFDDIAHLYLANARHGYLRWGADGKVRQLEQLHPWLRHDERMSGPTSTIEERVEQLDISTVVEISQALSGEVVLERLIDRLVRVALQHAGADRGLLICPRSDELLIYAEATAQGDEVAVDVRERTAGVSLPESLVRYSLRTGETVLLDDASSHNPFSADPFIRERRARSILCLPLINQGRFVGILYLENNLTPHAFTRSRLTVLKVLASQAAISLENIGLFRALADRERKIRRLVDANIIGTFVWKVAGPSFDDVQIVEANDAFLNMVGYDRDDLAAGRLSRSILSLPEWRERDALTVEELRVTGRAQPFEKEYLRKDGSRIPVLMGFAAFDELRVEGFAFVLDLTERKRAEEALRESERSLRSVIDGIPGLVGVLAPNGELESVNRPLLEYFGKSLEELKNWGINETIHREDLPRVVEIVGRSIASGKPFESVHRNRRFDGEYRWFDTRGVPFRDGSGRITRWYLLVTDIEDRKRAEEALRESERSLRSVLDGIAGLVAVAAPNGELEAVNRQVLEYFGRPAEELKDWGTINIVHPEDLPRVLEIFKKSIAAGIPFRYETRLRRFDAEYRWFEARFAPIRDDSGRLVRWYVLLTDIEDRIRATSRLQQMQSDFAHMNRVSTMGELAASLSHEITQPIASARNNTRAAQNFLDMRPPDLSEVKEALASVVGDIDRAGDIIDRIREHMKKAPPRKERFDLNSAVNEVIVLARSVTNRHAVSVQVRFADGSRLVEGDRVQVQQVILNLILNGVEAIEAVEIEPRELLISTGQVGTEVLVAVYDTGLGIDSSQVERIFDAFYTTKPSGTGMGLSICRSIIDAHGGRFWVEPNEPRGAVFRFTLPGAELRS